MPTARLETLADGIFAIAMTLLVLSIEAPSPGTITSSLDFQNYVYDLIPQMSVYALSFILLGSFWLNHHIFFLIKKTNTRLVWINILWLMLVVLVPFSTSLIGSYSQYPLSEIIFGINMFLIGILYLLNIIYAFRGGFMEEKVRPYAWRIIGSNILLPILAIISIAISFKSPLWSLAVYPIVPLITSSFAILFRVHKNKE
jgi:uncharacterized membrane protein